MRRAVGLALATALLLTGCGGARGEEPGGPVTEPAVRSPLAGCDQLTDPPPQSATPSPAPDGDPLPALTLTCFTGQQPFPLAELRGPAVVNLWASFCAPCRRELPVLQTLADQAEGQVHVLGVVTADTRSRAASFADDFGVRFPSLYDPGQQLLTGLEQIGLPALPVTLFVDRDGQVAHAYQGPPYDLPELTGMLAEHLRVEVPDG